MSEGATQEDIRQLSRYSVAHLLVCLPFVALSGFSVIPAWVFASVSIPLGAVVGYFTLRPPRAGVLAGISGMATAAGLSWVATLLGVMLDPRTVNDPRWALALGAGAVLGCLFGWYIWDVVRPQPLKREKS
jgi:apolipoprotein N-acyltransferase